MCIDTLKNNREKKKMRKIQIGDRFGLLTVIENLGTKNLNGKSKITWLCLCDCGNTRVANSGHLNNGDITHCGCGKYAPRKGKDLTGQIFGRWTVLQYAEKSKYTCRCICGVEKDVCSRELKNGESKSCGCLIRDLSQTKIKDLSGKVFGKLTVLNKVGVTKHRNVIWNCMCSCGNSTDVPSGLLHKGTTASCGCAFKAMLAARTPEQIHERCLKGAKTMNKMGVRFHWKTEQELVCRGSWEPKVIDYLNNNKIDFDWQIPIRLENGKLFIIDLYLTDQDMWVEIKGYARKAFLEKWQFFTQMYANHEIWNKQKLIDLGIF